MIAISNSDFQKYGCVNCGCEYCYNTGISGYGCMPVECGECHENFIVLADGLNQSRIGFEGTNGETEYPYLKAHPREGIERHKYVRPDIKPEYGEYWEPRGIGYDLSGFVKSKQAGERIVKMFEEVLGKKPKTWLDYREREPNWIQVKVQKEECNLEKLYELTKKTGVIAKEIIQDCVA